MVQIENDDDSLDFRVLQDRSVDRMKDKAYALGAPISPSLRHCELRVLWSTMVVVMMMFQKSALSLTLE